MSAKESKHQKFERIAENRTNKIITHIRLLGNCSNKNTYEYSADEVAKIFRAIQSELSNAKAKFSSEGNDAKFKL